MLHFHHNFFNLISLFLNSFSVRLHLHHLPIGGMFRISCHCHDRRLLNCHSRFVEIEQKYDTAYAVSVKVSLIFFLIDIFFSSISIKTMPRKKQYWYRTLFGELLLPLPRDYVSFAKDYKLDLSWPYLILHGVSSCQYEPCFLLLWLEIDRTAFFFF